MDIDFRVPGKPGRQLHWLTRTRAASLGTVGRFGLFEDKADTVGFFCSRESLCSVEVALVVLKFVITTSKCCDYNTHTASETEILS